MPDRQFPIVDLGASPVGLSAFKAFFRHVPADRGMAFVVVTHLSFNYKSHLAEMVARHTRRSVQVPKDGLVVGPEHVYVLTPGTTLTMRERVLQVVTPAHSARNADRRFLLRAGKRPGSPRDWRGAVRYRLGSC